MSKIMVTLDLIVNTVKDQISTKHIILIDSVRVYSTSLLL
jgi:hypothetical protein